MTTTPHTIGDHTPIIEAAAMMREHHIRHLPVLHGGKIVGIITARDIALVEGLQGADPRKILVSDTMTNDAYTVEPTSLVSEVAATMAEHKYGCAIVAQNNKVVGVFTTVDVCRVLAEVFDTRLK